MATKKVKTAAKKVKVDRGEVDRALRLIVNLDLVLASGEDWGEEEARGHVESITDNMNLAVAVHGNNEVVVDCVMAGMIDMLFTYHGGMDMKKFCKLKTWGEAVDFLVDRCESEPDVFSLPTDKAIRSEY